MVKLDYNEIKESLDSWKKETGICFVENTGLNINSITTGLDACIKDMPLEDLEMFLTKIASYVIFLRTHKSTIISRLKVMREQYNRILYPIVQEMENTDPGFKYKKIDEKEALIVINNGQLRKLKDDILDQEIKFEQIKDLPDSINAKLRILEQIYRQKQRRQYVQV